MVGPVMQAVDSVWLCLAISTKASACSIQVGPPEWPDLEKSTGSFCFLCPPLRISRVLGTIMAASGPPCPPELLVSCLQLIFCVINIHQVQANSEAGAQVPPGEFFKSAKC